MPSFSLTMISILSVSAVVACSSSGEEAPTGDGAAGSGGTTEAGPGTGGTPDAAPEAGGDAEADAAADAVTEEAVADVVTDAIADAGVCALEDGAGACDVCEDTSCCAEKTACYANAVCLAADDALDRCLEAADGGDAGVALCYTGFAGTNAQAQALSTCKRTNCMAQCGIP